MPGQPFAKGETVIVAVIGVLVKLIAVKDKISPVPLATRPMEGSLLVQLKLLPLTAPVKLTVVVEAPLQTNWLAGSTTSGVGFTVMVKLCEAPGQPFAEGVTVIVAVTGALVRLIALNAGIFPAPPAAKPIEVLSFVQVKLVVLTEPVKFTAFVVDALHKDWLTG